MALYGMSPSTDDIAGPGDAGIGRPPELVSPDSSVAVPAVSSGSSRSDGDAADLEDIFGGSDPERDFRCLNRFFALSGANPELLPLVEDDAWDAPGAVIFERDGVPYINNEACSYDEKTGGKLDGNFANLVESVVHTGGLS